VTRPLGGRVRDGIAMSRNAQHLSQHFPPCCVTFQARRPPDSGRF
jgi:hypothetical protein